MAKSFQIDLGGGRRLTWPGRIIVLLAALTALVAGGTCLYGAWGDGRLKFDPFLSTAVAAGSGLIVVGLGWVMLRVAGASYSWATR